MNELKLKLDHKRLKKYYKTEPNYSTDSGFDLYCPEELVIPGNSYSYKIDLKVSGAMYYDGNNIGYQMLPRSSTGAKTPLRLSNSIGIIDASYRGNLMAFVDNVSNNCYTVEEGTRLFQLVGFNGLPISVEVVKELDETDRGSKGFGSTGK